MPAGKRCSGRHQIVEGGHPRRDPSAQLAALGSGRGHGQLQGQAGGPRQPSRQVHRQHLPAGHAGVRQRACGLDQAGQGLLPGDDDPSVVELDLLADLGGRGERVVLGHDGSYAPGGVRDHDVLRAVGQDDSDDVPAAHAQTPQGLGGTGHLLAELAVGGGFPEEVQRDPVGEAAGGVVEHARQRFGDRGDDAGDAGSVMGAQIARGSSGRIGGIRRIRGAGGVGLRCRSASGPAHGVPFLESPSAVAGVRWSALI